MAGRSPRRKLPFTRLSKRGRRYLTHLWDWELDAVAKILELHPPEHFPRVADVGGGTGRMARVLAVAGYEVTIIDPAKGRTVSARYWMRHVSPKRRALIRAADARAARRNRQELRKLGIKVRREKFLVRHAFAFDLLVGLRPCGASKKLVRAAKYRPLVLKPCTAWCNWVWPGNSGSIRSIERYFRALGVGFRRQGRECWWTGESPGNAYVDG